MSKTTPKHATREGWLNAATELTRQHFTAAGYTVPKTLHVTCGWPSSRGTSTKKRAIGECWPEKASEDGACQIFISPTLKDVVDVLATHVHEIAHAVVGLKCGHKAPFKKCALAVGLEGKMTATHAGEALKKQIAVWSLMLGEYPHPLLKPGFSLGKKQTTRLIKAECGDCGCNIRITRKWLEEVGAPLCACNKKTMTFEISDELGNGGDDE
jgi:hypothetical protein